jgi:predicted transglutaminase-like cysteine proteinase
MFRRILLAAVSAAPLILGVQVAEAAGPAGFARDLKTSKGVQFIVARRPTLAPFAYVKFCRKNPGDCVGGRGSEIVELTAARNSQLQRVNASINRSIRARVDSPGVGGDVWEVGVSEGDCEDFALTKRRELVALGWSPRSLRIAVAYTGSGEGHAVLVVKTSKGDLVLDNRTSSIKNWRRTDLRWVKIQSGDNPRMWHAI